MPVHHQERSTVVQTFLSVRPPFAIRWGISIFFVLLVLLLVACWFIQYPDLVYAKAKLTGQNTPVELLARTDGRLVNLPMSNNQPVQKGDLIALLESRADFASVVAVQQCMDSLLTMPHQQGQTDIDSLHIFLQAVPPHVMGELQPAMQTFVQAFIVYSNYGPKGFYTRKLLLLQKDLEHIHKAISILQQQKGLANEDVALFQETFNANEKLARQQVLAPFEYRAEKGKLVQKKMSLPQIDASIENAAAQILEKNKEIATLQNEVEVQEKLYANAAKTFYNEILAWRFKYVVEAPVSGQLRYAAYYQVSQQVKAGQPLFFIAPPNSTYYAEAIIPQYNFGKVAIGQQVILKLPAYPSPQFGTLSGIVSDINEMPTDSGFLAKIILKAPLTTSYNKPIFYRDGLVAQAEVVVENMTVIERLLYTLRNAFQRQ